MDKFIDPKTGKVVFSIDDDGNEIIDPKWKDKIEEKKETEDDKQQPDTPKED